MNQVDSHQRFEELKSLENKKLIQGNSAKEEVASDNFVIYCHFRQASEVEAYIKILFFPRDIGG